MDGDDSPGGLLDSSPTLYKGLKTARDDFYTVFGFANGVREYLNRRRYLKRFPRSSISLGMPIDDKRCDIRIGKYSSADGTVIVGWVPVEGFKYRISIGSYTRINAGLKLILCKAHTLDRVSNHLNNIFMDRRGVELYRKYHKEEYGSIEIGNDVWIADDVTIIGKVKIGDGAVIGAKSVVTHDVEPYAVVAGAPARLIRYRFGKKTIRKLLETRWWDWSEDKIAKNLELFYYPERFVKERGLR